MLRTGRARWRAVAAALAVTAVIGVAAACGDDDEDTGAATTTEQPAPASTAMDGMTMTGPAVTEGTTSTAPGGGGTASTTAESEKGTVVEIPVAGQGLAYAVTQATAPAGTITLRSANPQAVPHNIAMDQPTQTLGEIVQDGGVSEITVELEPGTYEYYCSVPGHRQAGMVGTLTVT